MAQKDTTVVCTIRLIHQKLLCRPTVSYHNVVLNAVFCRVCVMEDDDIAHICQGSFAIHNSAKTASKVARLMQTLELEVETITKGDYQHFMQKEIFSQAESLTQTMQGRLKHVRTCGWSLLCRGTPHDHEQLPADRIAMYPVHLQTC